MVALEGVMHVSAFATAISIAYVGLDRIHWDDQKFDDSLSDTEKKFAELLRRFDLKPGIKYPRKSFTHMPVSPRLALFAVCHVAGIKVATGWLWPVHVLYRWYHVPFFKYFRKRSDRRYVAVLAAIALGVFVYVTSLDTWEMKSFPFPACASPHPLYFFDACNLIVSSEFLVPWFFFLSVLVSLWVIITGAASQRMQNVPPNCERLLKKVTDWLGGLGGLVRKEVENTQLTLPPPPALRPPARWGEIGRKHGDTLIVTLRKHYGADFASDCSDSDKLGAVLHKLDEPSLTKLIQDDDAGRLADICRG